MPVVLVTGASRGLGAEFARQFDAQGWTVHACARGANDGSFSSRIIWHRLDVADFREIERLANELRDTPIDLLINNAGVAPRESSDLMTLDFDLWRQVMEVNTLAPIKLIQSLVDQVSRSNRKQIVSISSELGSMTSTSASGLGRSGAWLPYRVSKAALNMAHMAVADFLAEKGIVSVMLHPGWVATVLGGSNAPTSPKTSVNAMIDLIGRLQTSDHGKFLAHDGRKIPW